MIGHISISDINYALPLTLRLLMQHGQPHTANSLSNARPTIEWPGLFVTEYTDPTRNVLFDEVRDANPFFHYLESMWILSGRRDVAFLAWVLPNMANYSDDGVAFHGAYGYRLRQHQGFDQVEDAIKVLRARPASRQVVMQVWDSKQDLAVDTKDVPCNDLIMCKIRDGKLNITVCNRSNDAIWGAYGANAVQFSMLQMYMAARVGVGVGRYVQVSDSMHVYDDTPYWQTFLAGDAFAGVSPYEALGSANMFNNGIETFDEQLAQFFVAADKAVARPHDIELRAFSNQVIQDAVCIFNSIRAHKNKRYEDASRWADTIIASDWQLACSMWLNRRVQKALL